MLALPNLTYRFNKIPIKSSANCFVNTDKLILVLWKSLRPKPVNTIIEIIQKLLGKNVGRMTFPTPRLCHIGERTDV